MASAWPGRGNILGTVSLVSAGENTRTTEQSNKMGDPQLSRSLPSFSIPKYETSPPPPRVQMAGRAGPELVPKGH